MPEDRYDDISDLTEKQQAFVRWARADYARIDALPADQRGGLAHEKQADPLGLRPDGTLDIVEPTDDDGQV